MWAEGTYSKFMKHINYIYLISNQDSQNRTLQLLTYAQTAITEPYMRLEVITNEERIHFVMSDLSTRRAEVLKFDTRGETRVRFKHRILVLVQHLKIEIKSAENTFERFSFLFRLFTP